MIRARFANLFLGVFLVSLSCSALSREVRIEPLPIWYDHNIGWFKTYEEYKNAWNSRQERDFQDCVARNQTSISYSCGKLIILGIKPNPSWGAINGQPYWNNWIEESFTQSRRSLTAPVVTVSRIYENYHAVFADTICPEGTTRRGETQGTISIGGQSFSNGIR